MQRLIIMSLLFAGLTGCSSSAFEGAVGKSDKDEDKDDKVVEEDDEQIVDDPEMVAGAFLTCEKIADAPETDPATELTVGCYVNDNAGHIQYSDFEAAWAVKDGQAAPQTIKNPTDFGSFHMVFILPKATVNTFTVSVRLSEGGSTQSVSVKLDSIASVSTADASCVKKITFKDEGSAENFVDHVGSLTIDWEKGELRVNDTGSTSLLLSYELTLVDDSILKGQVFFESPGYKNGTEPGMPGKWSCATGIDQEKSSFKKIGVVTPGGGVLGAAQNIVPTLDGGFPTYAFPPEGSDAHYVAGEIIILL